MILTTVLVIRKAMLQGIDEDSVEKKVLFKFDVRAGTENRQRRQLKSL